MLTLIVGGAGSGKSKFAESLITADSVPRRMYLATMLLWDKECELRAERHQQMRAEKAFETLEWPRNLAQVTIPPHTAVLLEDLSNLTANEFFSEYGSSGTFERIMRGIHHLNLQAEALVIVSNELFSDGIEYDKETADYLRCLSALNLAVAAEADQVYEVVCGIPISWKGVQA